MKGDEIYIESINPNFVLFGDSDVVENENWVNKTGGLPDRLEPNTHHLNKNQLLMLLPFNLLICKRHQFYTIHSDGQDILTYFQF